MDASADLRSFLSGPSPVVAPLLIGWTLRHETAQGTVAVALTEVEAYEGRGDPASHAWRGRSRRNAVMFGPAGHVYVYLSHGVHWCANVVTGPEGDPAAVLLRAGRVTEGAGIARARRGPLIADRSLARGPGCLGRALGLSGEQDGMDLLAATSELRLLPPHATAGRPVEAGPRVGVSQADAVPWRFWLADDPTVSAYRRSAR